MIKTSKHTTERKSLLQRYFEALTSIKTLLKAFALSIGLLAVTQENFSIGVFCLFFALLTIEAFDD